MNLFMGAAIFVSRRAVGISELSELYFQNSEWDRHGALPREMPQESWEIYNLRLARTGVPYKWIAATL